MTFSTSMGSVENALVIGAHSDDIEIGAGGTIRWLLQTFSGVRIHWVVLAAAAQRDAEARRSAESILGKGEHRVDTFRFRDGFFPYDAAVKDAFESIKSTARNPDVIFTHHRDDLHQDHRTVGELTWNTYRDHLIIEYEVPKYDGGLGSPNLFVPLARPIVDEKVSGLMKYFGTQRSKGWFTEETFLGLMRLRGIECRSPSGYAEAFYCRKAVWQF